MCGKNAFGWARIYIYFGEVKFKSYQKREQIYLRVAVNVIGVQHVQRKLRRFGDPID